MFSLPRPWWILKTGAAAVSSLHLQSRALIDFPIPSLAPLDEHVLLSLSDSRNYSFRDQKLNLSEFLGPTLMFQLRISRAIEPDFTSVTFL